MIAGRIKATLWVDLNRLNGDRVTTSRDFIVGDGPIPELQNQDWVRVVGEGGEAFIASVESVRGDLVDLHIFLETRNPRMTVPTKEINFQRQPELRLNWSSRVRS